MYGRVVSRSEGVAVLHTRCRCEQPALGRYHLHPHHNYHNDAPHRLQPHWQLAAAGPAAPATHRFLRWRNDFRSLPIWTSQPHRLALLQCIVSPCHSHLPAYKTAPEQAWKSLQKCLGAFLIAGARARCCSSCRHLPLSSSSSSTPSSATRRLHNHSDSIHPAH